MKKIFLITLLALCSGLCLLGQTSTNIEEFISSRKSIAVILCLAFLSCDPIYFLSVDYTLASTTWITSNFPADSLKVEAIDFGQRHIQISNLPDSVIFYREKLKISDQNGKEWPCFGTSQYDERGNINIESDTTVLCRHNFYTSINITDKKAGYLLVTADSAFFYHGEALFESPIKIYPRSRSTKHNNYRPKAILQP